MDKWVITGNIGKDATLRYSEQGTAMAWFSIAVNDWRNKDTKWVEAVLFGDRAEKLLEYLTKGTSVLITGRPQARAWKNKDGDAIPVLQVIVEDLEFTSRKGGKRKAKKNEDDWLE